MSLNLAILGIMFKSLAIGRFAIASVVVYLGMGWLGVPPVRRAVILDSKAVGCAVVNLDQFRITTRTILAKEHFWVGLIRPRPRKTITNEV